MLSIYTWFCLEKNFFYLTRLSCPLVLSSSRDHTLLYLLHCNSFLKIFCQLQLYSSCRIALYLLVRVLIIKKESEKGKAELVHHSADM